MNILKYSKYFENPLDCLFFLSKIKDGCLIKFKDDYEDIYLRNVESFDIVLKLLQTNQYTDLLGDYIKIFDRGGKVIKLINGINVYNPRYYPLNYIFIEYYMDYYTNFNIDYSNRTIIDIGANTGDTALYFASKGAKVYAFEPVKKYYDMALKNIDLNPSLKNNIVMYNCGISYKKGELNISSMKSTSRYIDKAEKYKIEILPMSEILKDIEPDLLKMDCEGCEFSIIEHCDLSPFNEIIFEQHSKFANYDYQKSIQKLKEQGFSIEESSVFGEDKKDLSLIHAFKE